MPSIHGYYPDVDENVFQVAVGRSALLSFAKTVHDLCDVLNVDRHTWESSVNVRWVVRMTLCYMFQCELEILVGCFGKF